MSTDRNHTARIVAAAALLAFALVPAAGSYARTLYLGPGGDDSADCVAGAEFKTLERAVSCLIAGDTLIVREGTYSGGVYVRTEATAEAPVLIQGESLEAVISGSGSRPDAIRVDGASHVAIDRLTIRQAARAGIAVLTSDHVTVTRCCLADNHTWGIFTGFADDVHFEGNECYGAKDEHGIYHSNSGDRFVIRGNLIHHNAANGIHINGDPEMGGDGVISFGLVEDNIIYGNGSKGGAGINMTHVQDVLVRNNLIYRNYAGGFTFYQDTGTFAQGSKRAVIMGNTVYFHSRYGRSGVNIASTSEKAVIAGNIFVSGGVRETLEVNSSHLSTIVSDYNLLWGVDPSQTVVRNDRRTSLEVWRSLSKNDPHSITADPLFLDPDSAGFSIADTSAAVDAGMPLDTLKAILQRLGGFEWTLALLDSLPDEDILGRSRPAGAGPDIGAYEVGAQPTGRYDFNGDGKLSVADAVALLLLGRADPEDPAADVNGDGRYTMADVIKLLLVIRDLTADVG
ncbi:MAG: right-handed parallel beta-helix repeat-containing protein [Candidatus Glassbacteria bacterium]|nr:right-handed parallel beta-helix repeat-containing protein [Candidatus Glassbacteria bacterium]